MSKIIPDSTRPVVTSDAPIRAKNRIATPKAEPPDVLRCAYM